MDDEDSLSCLLSCVLLSHDDALHSDSNPIPSTAAINPIHNDTRMTAVSTAANEYMINENSSVIRDIPNVIGANISCGIVIIQNPIVNPAIAIIVAGTNNRDIAAPNDVRPNPICLK